MSRENWTDSSGHPALQHDPVPAPRFDHLRTLTDEIGLWEHARYSAARVEHGFCTDDNGRALLVVSRQNGHPEDLADLAAIYLEFVLEASTTPGTFRNRRDADGGWRDEAASDDSQGRAWWGLGAASHSAPTELMRRMSADVFNNCAAFQSPHLRANAYAALGAAEMLITDPDHLVARNLLQRASGIIVDAARSAIPWPETLLTYDNARLPDALLAAGTTLGDKRLISTGLRLLEWLVGVETAGNHFSFTPTQGWSIGQPRPGFDQQPIEAWAMADACYRAWSVTGDAMWRVQAQGAARWLLGANDIGMALYDPETGATFDGLEDGTVNENCGAESTLAGIATLQVAASIDATSGPTLAYR